MRSVNALIIASILACGCASAPPPAPTPAAFELPKDLPPPPAPDEWNILPNPTTGEVEIYHRGQYAGVIDGTEPGNQDPPAPHQSRTLPPSSL